MAFIGKVMSLLVKWVNITGYLFKSNSHLCCSARATIMKYHRWGVLESRNQFLTILEVGRLRSRCLQVWCFSRPLFLVGGWQHSYVLTYPVLCECVSLVSLLPRTSVTLDKGATFMTPFNFYCIKYRQLRTSTYEFQGNIIQSTAPLL